MSFDLQIGFREKPTDLDETMSSLGFELERITPSDAAIPCRMESYSFFDENRPGNGVWFFYHDGIYRDHAERWSKIVEDPTLIVATGGLETKMRRTGFDTEKQMRTARFLRDFYCAVLYDPQSGKLITD